MKLTSHQIETLRTIFAVGKDVELDERRDGAIRVTTRGDLNKPERRVTVRPDGSVVA